MIATIIETNPDAGDHVGSKAGKPRIGIFVGGSSFPGGGSFKSEVAHLAAGSAIYGLAQKVDHLRGEIRGDHLAYFGFVGKKRLAFCVEDALDYRRFDEQAVVDQCAIGSGHL